MKDKKDLISMIESINDQKLDFKRSLQHQIKNALDKASKDEQKAMMESVNLSPEVIKLKPLLAITGIEKALKTLSESKEEEAEEEETEDQENTTSPIQEAKELRNAFKEQAFQIRKEREKKRAFLREERRKKLEMERLKESLNTIESEKEREARKARKLEESLNALKREYRDLKKAMELKENKARLAERKERMSKMRRTDRLNPNERSRSRDYLNERDYSDSRRNPYREDSRSRRSPYQENRDRDDMSRSRPQRSSRNVERRNDNYRLSEMRSQQTRPRAKVLVEQILEASLHLQGIAMKQRKLRKTSNKKSLLEAAYIQFKEEEEGATEEQQQETLEVAAIADNTGATTPQEALDIMNALQTAIDALSSLFNIQPEATASEVPLTTEPEETESAEVSMESDEDLLMESRKRKALRKSRMRESISDVMGTRGPEIGSNAFSNDSNINITNMKMLTTPEVGEALQNTTPNTTELMKAFNNPALDNRYSPSREAPKVSPMSDIQAQMNKNKKVEIKEDAPSLGMNINEAKKIPYIAEKMKEYAFENRKYASAAKIQEWFLQYKQQQSS